MGHDDSGDLFRSINRTKMFLDVGPSLFFFILDFSWRYIERMAQAPIFIYEIKLKRKRKKR